MDHLLSMEKEFLKEIEKNNLRKLGLKNKKLPKKSYLLKFLLGFERLFLSNIVL